MIKISISPQDPRIQKIFIVRVTAKYTLLIKIT